MKKAYVASAVLHLGLLAIPAHVPPADARREVTIEFPIVASSSSDEPVEAERIPIADENDAPISPMLNRAAPPTLEDPPAREAPPIAVSPSEREAPSAEPFAIQNDLSSGVSPATNLNPVAVSTPVLPLSRLERPTPIGIPVAGEGVPRERTYLSSGEDPRPAAVSVAPSSSYPSRPEGSTGSSAATSPTPPSTTVGRGSDASIVDVRAAPSPPPVTVPPDLTPRFRASVRAAIERAKQYPASLRSMELEGRVTVAFTVETDGSATNIRVVTRGPHPLMDEASIRAVKTAAPYGTPPGGQSLSLMVTLVYRLENAK